MRQFTSLIIAFVSVIAITNVLLAAEEQLLSRNATYPVTGESDCYPEQVLAERRGLWLSANQVSAHYATFHAKRIEDQYDKIRQRCRQINSALLIPQTPQMVERNALIGSLYYDGWWLYYATAIFTHPEADDPKAFVPSYGRFKGTSAWDYLDRITSMHQEVDQLLNKPKDQWPKQ